ncbi:MAG TPA: glycosyltransferase family 4 protein [Mycobacteriales bacterium]
MSNNSDGRPRIAVILSGWPRVSESFAVNEVLALRRAGLLGAVLALKPGDGGSMHPAAAELAPLVEVLPAGYTETQAEAAVSTLDGLGITAVHGYFAHAPAAVAALVADKFGLPYGFSVHALDARKVSKAEMHERGGAAAVVVACNSDVAADVSAAGVVPTIVRHGVDLAAFPATEPPGSDPVALLAVGRLVEKKGFDVLLAALSTVDRRWRLRLVGDGPLRERLTGLVDAYGLGDRVSLTGCCTHATLPAEYAAADLVVVPSVVDSTGDRDGLPNVVLESMASRRPVVASAVAAIPSAVRDGVTGALVPPRDPDALARALTALIDDPARRVALGRGARAVAETEFGLTSRTEEFCRVLERAYA